MPESKVVCISGGTRGLGRSMVRGFIERGARVAACGRSSDAIENLRKEFGTDHVFECVDVRDEESVQGFADRISRDMGPVNFLINNAAVINRNAFLWEVSASEFAKLMDINVNGVANMIRSFVPGMIDNGSGVIVNFSSTWGRSTSPEVAPYCASKFAIEGLSSSLAQELPAGLACVAMNPGIINTDMLQSCFGPGAEQYPTADQWAQSAVPFILKLSASDNGASLTVS